MRPLTKSLICLAFLDAMLFMPMSLEAQTRFTFQDSLGTYKVVFRPHVQSHSDAIRYRKPLVAGTHELRLGMGYAAQLATGDLTTDSWWNPSWNDDFKVDGMQVREPSWYTVGVEGGRWYRDWLYVGGAFVWSGGFSRIINGGRHEYAGTYSYHNYALLPIVRFAWVRRGIVQLYSGLGFGLAFSHSDSPKGRDYNVDSSFDFTFIGISVGRDLFGYFDISGGSRGVISFGIGYRFFNKK